MTTPSTDTPSIRERLDRLRPAVLEVAQRYGASNLRVFGSVALNQEHQDSDLDLLVDLQANQSLLALVGITQELERLLGCPVDVAEPDSLHPLIRAEVLQHVGLDEARADGVDADAQRAQFHRRAAREPHQRSACAVRVGP
jgi:predicted nucleotidyltransferase